MLMYANVSVKTRLKPAFISDQSELYACLIPLRFPQLDVIKWRKIRMRTENNFFAHYSSNLNFAKFQEFSNLVDYLHF